MAQGFKVLSSALQSMLHMYVCVGVHACIVYYWCRPMTDMLCILYWIKLIGIIDSYVGSVNVICKINW